VLKALVAGWFSFAEGHATAGDVLAGEVARDWLLRAGFEVDVAMVAPVGRGCDWRAADPARYSHVVFVCGPFQRGELETEFLVRFARCNLVGLDLSMLLPLGTWNPFDFLIERDSDRAAHPDIAFAARSSRPVMVEPPRSAGAPMVGICRVEAYDGARVAEADAAIDRLVASGGMVPVDIDTRLDANSTGLRNAAEVESQLARMEAVVSTRLHGMVLALKNGVPVVAIDPEPAGAKVRRQAEVLQWPAVLTVDAASDEALRSGLAYCLSEPARAQALACRSHADRLLDGMREDFIRAMTDPSTLRAARRRRDEPFVSIIITCYNQARYLHDSIGSALAQTHARREVIVIDDGSSDDTSAVAARYPDVKCVRQPNAGLSAARNSGIRESHGDFLVFLDADDRLLPDALRAGLDCFLIRPECAFVSGHYRMMLEDGTPQPDFTRWPPEPDAYRTLLQRNYIGMHATVMYRRAAFDEIGGFNDALPTCEDYEMYLRIARAHPVYSHDRVVAEYRRHDAAMSMDPTRMLNGALGAFAGQRSFIEGKPDYLKAQQSGIRSMRRYAPQPLLKQIVANVRALRLGTALRMSPALFRYLPAWLRALWLEAQLRIRAATLRRA
jgi:glycosyltransferase involved in cell wall biosynthesis